VAEKGKPTRVFDIAQVRKLIAESNGNVAQMSALLHCTKNVLATFVANHPALAEELELARRTKPDPKLFDADVDEMRVALAQNAGSIARTAKMYQTSPGTLSDYLKRHPELETDAHDMRMALMQDSKFDPSPQLVIEAIDAVNGNIAALAKQFKVSRSTFMQYVNERPEVQQALYSAKEGMLDMVETSLYRRALAGDGWAVCFMLKTQGRKRGYIERGESFNLNVNLDNLSIEQLERLATGEHPSLVLGGAGASPTGAGSETIDAAATEGASDFSAEEEAA